jgi:uncharacterized membrane protein YjfL (UPF0719 family)
MWSVLAQAEPVATMSAGRIVSGVIASLAFGITGIFLLLLGYFLFDRLTPRIDTQKELQEKNLAVAVVIAALLLGIAYIVAHVVQ